ncbi:MAG: DUF424 family protein [Candidatus Micrarchaeota archaeon]
MYFKLHEREGRRVLAACDRELIGKVLEEGGVVLDLAAYASFYKGDLCTEKELLSRIPSASSLNLIGKKAVAAGLRSGAFPRDEVKYIKGIPHIQLYRI